jgi:hypothetical protein
MTALSLQTLRDAMYEVLEELDVEQGNRLGVGLEELRRRRLRGKWVSLGLLNHCLDRLGVTLPEFARRLTLHCNQLHGKIA